MEVFTTQGKRVQSDEDFLSRIDSLAFAALSPFDDKVLNVLDDLSRKLMRSPLAGSAPQLVTLGFWLRCSQLSAIKTRFMDTLNPDSVGTARGVALHLPPQNVDTLFVYSWALSLLAGNVNVIRLPSEMTDVLVWLVDTVLETLAAHDLANTQIFCRYPHSSSLTAQLSERVDLRMIWGGDKKIRAVSRSSVRLDGVSLGFPDRKSFCVVSGPSYNAMTEADRDVAAVQLYNDIYWFDQMGCGSPRVIFWLGSVTSELNDLCRRLDAVAEGKSYVVETGTAIEKFSYMNSQLASAQAHTGTRFSNRLSVLHSDAGPTILNEVQGGGLLYGVKINEIIELAPYLNRQTQTITHLGLTPDQITSLANVMSQRGGFRLVPLGEALSFADIWDGVNLISTMTRKITVKL